MIYLGEKQSLRLNRFSDYGAYLICKDGNEVLLPNKYVKENLATGDMLEVFVYSDSEDRPVATTLQPLGEKNRFACLRVKDVNRIGAFLDWGLEKDLLLPFSEQSKEPRQDKWVLVYIIEDPKTTRLIASSRIGAFLNDQIDVEVGDKVDVLIGPTTEIGLRVIVNDAYLGMIYHNEIFEELQKGSRQIGYVKHIREDGKLDISLKKLGLDNLEDGAKTILSALEKKGGVLSLNDKSDPEEIRDLLHMSKKNFKKSLGILYKKRLVKIHTDHISMV